MSEETRRAPAAFALHDAGGAITAQGTGEAVIGDDDLRVGPVTVPFLDADALRASDHRLELDCWPSGTLVLSQLGRRFDTFATELSRSRNAARVAGLLAHGITPPETFTGALLGGSTAVPADCLVYETHVTFVPSDADPWQLPFGALATVDPLGDPPAVLLGGRDGVRTVVGRLARRRDDFHRAISARRDAQGQLLNALTGSRDFADGLGVPRSRVSGFDALVARWCAPARAGGAEALVQRARGGEPRLGLVQLLDPEGESPGAPTALPEGWASFLLVPAGPLVVLEVLAGPSAATYVFEGTMESVNRDLQLLHFRRAALALREQDAVATGVNPHRLALRRLAPLQRLRSATRARIIHNEGWRSALEHALNSA